MNVLIQLGAAAGMLATASGMIYYENFRTKIGRPLSKNEHAAVPFWITYLVLIALGVCLSIAAIIRS